MSGREGVREEVRQGDSESEGVSQGGRERNLPKNPSEVPTKCGYMKLD